MVDREAYEESTEESPIIHDADEAEETMSLCDLPIYSDSADWGRDCGSTSSSTSSDGDFFEFFSEDFSAQPCPAKDIIFCGKLIPCKEQPICCPQIHEIDSNKQQIRKKRSFFKWRSLSLGSKSKKSRPEGGDMQEKCDLSARRVSILTSPAKSRWHLFMFGLMRFPTEMELRDIKNRQVRRHPETMFRSFSGQEEMSLQRKRAKGFWGMLRALGCNTHQTDSVANVSLSCIPRV